MNKLLKISGILLGIAGALLLFINSVFTPQIMAFESYTEGVATSAYAWRLGLASLTAMITMIASVGIYSYYNEHYPNTWKSIILLLSLVVGNSMLLAHEWNQFLFVRELAISFPDTLDQLNDLEGFSLYDLSAILGAALFFFGWLIGVIILWTGKIVRPHIALLILIGLIASPLLAAFIPIVYAGIISSLLLASGWFLLGKQLYFSVSLESG